MLLTRISRKLMNRAVAGAWERWTDFAEESKEMRVKIQRALSKV